MAKPKQMFVRIEEDVKPMLVASAKENSRSLPKEANFVLRGVYRSPFLTRSLKAGVVEEAGPRGPERGKSSRGGIGA